MDETEIQISELEDKRTEGRHPDQKNGGKKLKEGKYLKGSLGQHQVE